jgi:hypothetical protein
VSKAQILNEIGWVSQNRIDSRHITIRFLITPLSENPLYSFAVSFSRLQVERERSNNMSSRRISQKRVSDTPDPPSGVSKRGRAEVHKEPTVSPPRPRRGVSQAPRSPQKSKAMKMKLVGMPDAFDELKFIHPEAIDLFEIAEVVLANRMS